mmetsp:Transcript_10558/g.15830  ORF Transcript_10558/g.15830 Transcript_10558/m.15830 type:complete len:203 (-) Transcript_10558:157-765(-)|eukprot:CAMPEP_0116038750 /NCGR_PEP_ID=MMETSP0321-20121206/23041_1 /TAXON_ID=163516 /ORGANISM="Leptocylindrus danicus var. danicus, Strain B650" /LENGTH=202 /DNA_ID=CAMNT_0003517617 /DNA_START=101 /DNA_END=712 /DNA_ORIENTATION=+
MSTAASHKIAYALARRSSSSSTIIAKRTFATAISNANSNPPYKSPLKPFFDNISKNQTTSGLNNTDAVMPEPEYLKCGIRRDALRFKANHFPHLNLPPFIHTDEHKVTLLLELRYIPFQNNMERELLIEMAGKGGRVITLYNGKHQLIQMSSTKFASRIENMRYLTALVERLMVCVKGLAKEGDDFYHSGKVHEVLEEVTYL